MAFLKKMLLAELAAEEAASQLTDAEREAYASAVPDSGFVESAASPPRPGAPRPQSPARQKKAFNNSVVKHFSTGRHLTDAHRKAISEGLKRWHAAHGRGTYTSGQRRSAVSHLKRRFGALAQHHSNMHAVHKTRAASARKRGDHQMHAVHKTRAAASLKKHRVYSDLATSPVAR